MPPAPPSEPLAPEAPRSFSRAVQPRPVGSVGPATEALFARLRPADIDAIVGRLTEEHRDVWQLASDEDRKRLALALGVHYAVPGVLERTGLSAEMPPAEIHSMVHGMLSEAGGSYYLADLVLECFEAVGSPLAPDSDVLDFSCSSARVVRALAAARPDVRWHGCDPNSGAIDWASEHFSNIDFFVADTTPPLPVAPGSFNAAFAISVWSHYSEAAALSWLEEMSRLIAPGGLFIVTTHGLQSCAWFTQFQDPAINAKLGEGWIVDTARRLQDTGHCFWSVFGQQGDWGVVADDWGLAFFTPEWLLENVTPAWSVRQYMIGRAYGNQDVYVLERR
jgi:SAM-dependent methyltransferase